MPEISSAGRNAMLDRFGVLATHVSLHEAFPGDTGTSEHAGGSPAYARKPIGGWAAAAAGDLDDTGTVPVFDVNGTAITPKIIGWLGFWTAISAGTFLGCAPLGGENPRAFTAGTDDLLTAPTHSYSDGQPVVVFSDGVSSLPTGLTEGTVYYVRDSTANTMKLAATSGGTAIDLTAVGAGRMSKINPQTVTTQGTITATDTDVYLTG